MIVVGLALMLVGAGFLVLALTDDVVPGGRTAAVVPALGVIGAGAFVAILSALA